VRAPLFDAEGIREVRWEDIAGWMYQSSSQLRKAPSVCSDDRVYKIPYGFALNE
jgi:hypothetical protein